MRIRPQPMDVLPEVMAVDRTLMVQVGLEAMIPTEAVTAIVPHMEGGMRPGQDATPDTELTATTATTDMVATSAAEITGILVAEATKPTEPQVPAPIILPASRRHSGLNRSNREDVFAASIPVREAQQPAVRPQQVTPEAPECPPRDRAWDNLVPQPLFREVWAATAGEIQPGATHRPMQEELQRQPPQPRQVEVLWRWAHG